MNLPSNSYPIHYRQRTWCGETGNWNDIKFGAIGRLNNTTTIFVLPTSLLICLLQTGESCFGWMVWETPL